MGKNAKYDLATGNYQHLDKFPVIAVMLHRRVFGRIMFKQAKRRGAEAPWLVSFLPVFIERRLCGCYAFCDRCCGWPGSACESASVLSRGNLLLYIDLR